MGRGDFLRAHKTALPEPAAPDAEPNGAAPLRRTYTLSEVAGILGMSRNAVYTAAVSNTLPAPAFRVGRKWLVSRAALHRALGIADE